MIVIDWIDSDALICQHIRPLFVLVYDGFEDIELIMFKNQLPENKFLRNIFEKDMQNIFIACTLKQKNIY